MKKPWLPRKLLALYEPALAWGMRRQPLVAAVALLMLLLAALVYTQIGKSFMPTLDEGDLIVGIEKLPSISSGAERRARPEDPAGDHAGHSRGDRHRRACRRRRDRSRPDGAEPDRHLFAAEAAR
jgi:hypothetical protein